MSNNASNKALNRVQVVPITSRVDRVYPCEALVMLNGEVRKAMADQLTTVSKLRFGARLGLVNEPDMQLIDAAIGIQLGIAAAPWRRGSAR